jgi:hypothetical protein
MTNMQLYFAIGVPTFSVLVGIVIGIFQQVHTLNQFNLRFISLEGRMTSIENRIDSRMAVIEADIKTLLRIIGDMDPRIARLEERTSR